MPLLLAFIALPLAEIAVFILVGRWIGVLPTLGLIVAAALAGTAILRTQGLATAGALRTAMDRMSDPSVPMANGVLVMFAGVLLVVPGFLTDAVALLLLLPPVRSLILSRIAARVRVVRPGAPHAPDIIDGEFHEIEPDRIGTSQAGNDRTGGDGRPPSGWTRH